MSNTSPSRTRIPFIHSLYPKRFLGTAFIVSMLTIPAVTFTAGADDDSTGTSATRQNDAELLNDYVKSMGYSSVIVFDSNNIKQFWVDKSVFAKNDDINVVLHENNAKKWESVPLNIQLANVNETLDCTVDIVTETPDVSFSVLNNKSTALSQSEQKDDFIHYHILSSTFHLEDAPGYVFSLKLNSNLSENVSAKKIILSFTKNKNSQFLASPGTFKITQNDVTLNPGSSFSDDTFTVKGKNSVITSTKKILVQNNSIDTSVKAKNIGDTQIRLYVGFAIYAKDGTRLDTRNYPYKEDGKIMKVISAEEGSSTIVVDSYQEWIAKGWLALDAKEDFSDLPSTSLADGRIVEIKKLENGNAEITLDKPLKSALKEGTNIRVHGKGGGYFYTNTQVLKPGEEKDLTSSIRRDDVSPMYGTKSFPRGTYYVVPLVLSYVAASTDEENTVQISDYSVSY